MRSSLVTNQARGPAPRKTACSDANGSSGENFLGSSGHATSDSGASVPYMQPPGWNWPVRSDLFIVDQVVTRPWGLPSGLSPGDGSWQVHFGKVLMNRYIPAHRLRR